MTADLRDSIFLSLDGTVFEAAVSVAGEGVVSGLAAAAGALGELGCSLTSVWSDGSVAANGDRILVFRGSARAVAMAEDRVIGRIAKPTGIARATARAVALARGRARVVAGAGKKLPQEFKPCLRRAVHDGGGEACITPAPFLYLDKNYVRMFGSVAKALAGVAHMDPGYIRVVQIRGEREPLAAETRAAIAGGAGIVMVDTGRLGDLEAVTETLRDMGRREAVEVAFAGGIRLEDIDAVCSRDVDILDIGAAIVDAPLADCRLDVVGRAEGEGRRAEGLELNLLDKTEVRIHGVDLDCANLTDLARAAAMALQLPGDKVAVIDVRPGQVALDILLPSVPAEAFFGREKALLNALATVPGVRLAEEARVHSRGILGAICLDEREAGAALRNARALAGTVRDNLRAPNRAGVVVFPTGSELAARNIEDTNTPYLCKIFEQAGFFPEAGPCLPDRLPDLVAALDAASRRARAVVTTGGVGAEDKDFSVEAVLELDPDAAAPYLVRFAAGHGRHVKDGVRIAVGRRDDCLLVALPGPHDEVRLVGAALVEGVKRRLDKAALAERLATTLRKKFIDNPGNGRRWRHGHAGQTPACGRKHNHDD